MFLVETWLDEASLLELRNKMGFGDTFGVSRITRGGGLTLFWKKDVELSVENFSLNYIDAIINKGKENSWGFTGFHGFLETQNHIESWNRLRWFQHKFSLPWISAGDFNEIIKTHEKIGGKPRPNGQMQDFRDVLDECGFIDMGFVGNKFTRYKNYLNGNTIWERLDRAVATQDWMNLFPASKVLTL